MLYLLGASLLWAFSFGLIGNALKDVDFFVIAWIRLFLSLLIFLPFCRPRRFPPALHGWLLLIGAVQYGLMYMAYIASFRYLASHEVALLTVFTPLYVAAAHNLARGRFHWLHLSTALAALAATGGIVYRGGEYGWAWRGFLLVQASNVCFALGQVGYARVMEKFGSGASGQERIRDDVALFAWLYLGALLAATVPAARVALTNGLSLARHEILALIYLGLVPSGIGFFLWNVGARRVDGGTLAVMNNAKIPLAVLVSLWVFREDAQRLRLVAGALVIALCVILNRRQSHSRRCQKF